MSLTTNLVSYYKLDESSGNASDSVASNTLTNNGSMTYGTGKINNGAVCSPTGPKYLSVANGSQTGLNITGNISISLWVKVATAPTSGNEVGLVSKRHSGSIQYSFSYFNNSGTLSLRFLVSNDGTTASDAIVAQILTIGTFMLVEVVWTASTSTAQYYVNGSSIGSAVTTGITSIFNGTASFQLGNVDTTEPIDATLDEVGIWSRTLTSGEVTQLYNAGAGLQYPFIQTSSGASFLLKMI